MAIITLVRPPSAVESEYSKPVECLALGYLAAALRFDGHTVHLLDAMLHNWSAQDTSKRIIESVPDVVGFTVVTESLPPTIETISQLCRDLGYRGLILVGGHSVSFIAERVLDGASHIDAVVKGEGESAIRRLVEALESGRDWRESDGVVSRSPEGFRSVPAHRERHLDGLPVPARDLVREVIDRDGLVAVSTSRGCFARCTFCSVPRFYGLERGTPQSVGQWLSRCPDAVVAEIQGLYDTFGLLELLIVDDEFFGGTADGHQRAWDIGRKLEAAHMPLQFAISCRAENIKADVLEQLQRGGLAHVFVGLESGSSEELRLFGKQQTLRESTRAVATVKALGLSFQTGFMMFNHRSTLDTVRRNLDFLYEIGEAKPYNIDTSASPYFGTPLATLMQRDGVIISDGLRREAGFLDAKVAAAREIARSIGDAAAPVVSFIASLQSAITLEWRRRVPGRSADVTRLINAFENGVNHRLAAIMERGLQSLEKQFEYSIGEVVDVARADLAQFLVDTEVSKGLLLPFLIAAEGRLRYWSQKELILFRKSDGC